MAAAGAWLASAASCGLSADFVGSGGTGGSSRVTVTTTTGSGGLGPGTGGTAVGHLAGTCTTSTDCGADLSCLTPTSNDVVFGGGAPAGFCTKGCSVDADCATFDGVCYTVAPDQPGRCTLSCTIGKPISGVASLFGEITAAKCLGRSDVRCANAGADNAAVCLPTCGADEQCDGFACDPRTAVCVAKPNTGMPLGAACDPAKSPSVCAGTCIGFRNGSAMCSDPCVVGAGPSGAVLPDDCGGSARGLCAFHPVTSGVGDTGYCTPACAAHSDCQTPAFWCFGVPELTPSSHAGYCFAATPCPNGQQDCDGSGDAGADASTDAGGSPDAGDGGTGARVACTDTPAGPLCLDPSFPLYGPDAGPVGPPDAGATDAGPSDAGPTDGSAPDAGGPSDAATDAPSDGMDTDAALDAGEPSDAGDAG
jgi:hypothetical protein